MSFLMSTKNTNISPLLLRKDEEWRKQYMKKCILFGTIVFIILFLVSIPVFAGDANNPEKKDFDSNFGYYAFQFNAYIYGDWLQGIADFLKFNLEENRSGNIVIIKGAENSVGEAARQCYKMISSAVQPVGYTLAVLYFLISIIEKVQLDNLNVEHLIKGFIKLFIAIFLISKSDDFLLRFAQLSDSMVNLISNTVTSGNSDKLNTLYDDLCDMGFVKAIAELFGALIPGLMSLICMLVCYAMSFSRIIQFYVYAALAPIGMVNIYEGGMNSSGFRYLKKFLAIGLQGVMIIAILAISNGMTGINVGITASGEPDLLNNLIIMLVTTMLVIKSASWSNDLLGV